MRDMLATSLPAPLSKILARQDLLVEGLFKRPQSLSALLPYDEYLPEDGIFRLKDGSLGAVFEASLIEHEPLTGEKIVDVVASLKSWFNLPSNTTLSVLYDQAFVPRSDSVLTEEEENKGHPVSKYLHEEKVRMIRDACATNSRLAPLSRKCFISLRYFPDLSKKAVSSQMWKQPESTLFREMKFYVRQMQLFRQLVVNFESNSKVLLRRMTAEHLIDVLRLFFNPKTYYKRSFARYNSVLPISDQVLYNSPTLDVAGIQREGFKTRTLSLKTSPSFCYPGCMSYFTKLDFPFKLSLNFKLPTRKQSKNFFDLKEFFLQNTPSARARRQREEILDVQERLARDDRCLHMTFTVTVDGESDEVIDQRVREIVNVFNNDLECETIVEDDIGLGLCMNSLPLNYIPKADHASQRFIRILRSDAIKFVPIFDSFRGFKKPEQLFLSRENNLVPFSLSQSESGTSSKHTAIVGDSGSGKSKFAIDALLGMKRSDPEALVFAIEKGSSCRMAAELYNGVINVFERSKEPPTTVFRGVYDEDKFAFLTTLFLSGIKFTSPSFEIESIHGSAISKALKLAYRRKIQQAGLAYVEGELLKQGSEDAIELSMEDFISELGRLPSEKGFESFGEAVADLLKYLMPFYGEGIYARYFQSSLQSKKTNDVRFYIYDLAGLDGDPTLQALMTMACTEEIRQIKRLPEYQYIDAWIYLDELGVLGNNPIVKDFIVDFAERGRKLAIWLMSSAPRPQNYIDSEAGQAMLGVADHIAFLQMSSTNVSYLAKNSELLDEADVQIINSLRTVRGEFADVYYMNKKKTKRGAFRFFPTPSDNWISPTNALDAREAAKALKKFKDHKWRALEYLVDKFPKGVSSYNEGKDMK